MTLPSTLPGRPSVPPTGVNASPHGTSFHPHRLLELHLQRQWQQRRREPIPLQVRCNRHQDRLVLLIEHASGVRPDPRFTLSQFAAALQQVDPKLHRVLFKIHDTPPKLTVGLYLRVLGESQPYAAGGCTLAAPVVSRPPEAVPSSHKASTAVSSPVSRSGTAPGMKPQRSPQRDVEAGNSSGIWLGGALLCLTTFAGSFWFMMQPCYVQPCTPLHRAEQLKTTALKSVATAENWEQLKTIASQLEESQRLSRQVPLWSSYHDRAQALDGEIKGDLATFTPITQAFEKAVQAANQSKSPPYTLEQWQATRRLWVEVLDTLRGIPADHLTYDLAQRKIHQYQGYLKLVDDAIVQETLGQEVLARAQRSAQLAQLQKANWEKSITERPNLDRTTLWQQIQNHWQTALETLREIPPGTTAYKSIAEHRQQYQQALAQFQDQNREANAATNRFQQAQDSAQKAQQSEREDRWDVARNHWEVALVSLQQVPQESVEYVKAQVLLPQYSKAYQRAQSQAAKFVNVEQARQELAKLCTTTPTICYFTVTPELMAVQVTTDYESKILTAGLWGDQHQALKHLQGLEDALKGISNATKIPLELYDPNGSLNGRYVPPQ